MTISSTTRIAGPFVGNGTASAFPFTFKVFAAGDLDVIRLATSTGVETTLVLTTDYTVALNIDQDSNPGGTVTLVAGPLATGFTLTITSDIANLQPTDLTNQGGFYPEVITDSFDRATIQIQQMAGDVSRSIKAPISDGSPDMELPAASVRANTFLAFDANGVPTVQAASSSASPTSITRQVFSGTGSQTVFTLASDPGGAGNSAQVFIGGVYQQRNTYTIAGTTLTFNQAPVAGTNNIEFVNFLIGSGSNGVGIVTLTGDVTGSGTGTVPATVAANAVTFAKMQQIATATRHPPGTWKRSRSAAASSSPGRAASRQARSRATSRRPQAARRPPSRTAPSRWRRSAPRALRVAATSCVAMGRGTACHPSRTATTATKM
jgi:hypothetical protein